MVDGPGGLLESSSHTCQVPEQGRQDHPGGLEQVGLLGSPPSSLISPHEILGVAGLFPEWLEAPRVSISETSRCYYVAFSSPGLEVLSSFRLILFTEAVTKALDSR